jgi:hypothetical protein
MNQKRGITVLGSGSKAYLTWVQKRTRSKLRRYWNQDDRIEHGGLPGRGTSQAISKVLGVRKKCKQAGISTITFLEDAKKAFDTISREKAIQQWGQILGKKNEIFQRHKKRHEKIIACTQIGEEELNMNVSEGVAQGDPNGPPMYSLGFTGAIEDTSRYRRSLALRKLQVALRKIKESFGAKRMES